MLRYNIPTHNNYHGAYNIINLMYINIVAGAVAIPEHCIQDILLNSVMAFLFIVTSMVAIALGVGFISWTAFFILSI